MTDPIKAIARLENARTKARGARVRATEAIEEIKAGRIEDAFITMTEGDDRTRKYMDLTRDARGFLGDEDPGPGPGPEPDPNVYVFDTDSITDLDDNPSWRFAPDHGADVYLIQSSPQPPDVWNLEIPPVPQRPVASYSLQLWMSGRPTEKRSVLAWWVGGTGQAGDNDQKFSDLVFIDKGTGKIRFRQGFGVNQEEQVPTTVTAPWAEALGFSVHHRARINHLPTNVLSSSYGRSQYQARGSWSQGQPPIGKPVVGPKGIHLDLGDRGGLSPVGTTYDRVRLELVFA